MKNKKNSHNKTLMLNTLALSVFMASGHVYALQVIADEDLRSINGQDGVQISTSLAEANIDQLYWADEAGRGTAGATNST